MNTKKEEPTEAEDAAAAYCQRIGLQNGSIEYSEALWAFKAGVRSTQSPRLEDRAAGDLLSAMDRACKVFAVLYAKYQTKIGPYASQAQQSNVELRHARDAVAKMIGAAALASATPSAAVGEVYTMEALVPGGEVRCHVSLNRPLPAGTKLYTTPTKPGHMVVPERRTAKLYADESREGQARAADHDAGWNACIDAVLKLNATSTASKPGHMVVEIDTLKHALKALRRGANDTLDGRIAADDIENLLNPTQGGKGEGE